MENSTLTMLIALVSTSGVFTLFLCIYTYLKRKEIPGAQYLIFYTAVLVLYIFSFAFELACETPEEAMRWIFFEYFGIGFGPPLALLLALYYIGKNVPRKAAASLFVIPAISLIMIATNDMHHLFYKSIFFREGAPTPIVEVEVGEWYIVQGAFTFSCMLASVVVLVRKWNHTNKAFRVQLATLIAGQLFPMIGSFVYLMGVTPYGIDPVPMVLCVTSALYIVAMVQSRILTIVPIAKERIFESMREGAVVLDLSNRIVDFNESAGEMIPGLTSASIGSRIGEIWPQLAPSSLPDTREKPLQQEMVWTVKLAEATYQARSSIVRGRAGVPAGSLLMLIDVTEQKRLQDKLMQLAYYDGLTNLLNRARFIQRGKELLESACRFGQSVSFVLLDIDSFKSINDSYGHETGDRAIVHVAEVVGRELPPDALFARFGGEEFVLALPSAGLDEAGALAERLRAALEAEPLGTEDGRTIPVTSSFGVAAARDAGDTLEALLREADAALYRAKREGRNLVRLAAPAAGG